MSLHRLPQVPRGASRVAARGSHGWCLIEQSESDLCDFVITSRVGTAHHNVIIACNVFCEQMKRDCSAWRMVKLKGDWWAIGGQCPPYCLSVRGRRGNSVVSGHELKMIGFSRQELTTSKRSNKLAIARLNLAANCDYPRATFEFPTFKSTVVGCHLLSFD